MFQMWPVGHASLNCRVKKFSDGKPSHFLLRVLERVLKRVKRVVLERDLSCLTRAKRVKCLQSWMVFADFDFLSQEELDESDKQSFKFQVIKEVFSSSF